VVSLEEIKSYSGLYIQKALQYQEPKRWVYTSKSFTGWTSYQHKYYQKCFSVSRVSRHYQTHI